MMPSKYIVDISENQFENEVIAFLEATPVIVVFRANWSGPCKMLDPILEEMVTEAEGAFRLVRMDTDKLHSPFINEHEINNIPDVRFYYKGQRLGGFKGYQSKDFISDYARRVLEYIKNNFD
ncbi:MAG: hypothetical protein H0S79_23060 [Anaerolineaceae bacterium]|nr:hypothetical protein [Anaerolineaceae bacterium]